jgi:hypothetical protein
MPKKNKRIGLEQPIHMNAFAMRCEAVKKTKRTSESWKALGKFFDRELKESERERKSRWGRSPKT